jgi:hypothetical protein
VGGAFFCGGGPGDRNGFKCLGVCTNNQHFHIFRQDGDYHGNGEPRKPQIVMTYDYTDENGAIRHRTNRYDGKEYSGDGGKKFSQCRPDGKGGWIWKNVFKDITPILYRLPELIASPITEPVFLCEGEKDADRLGGLGLVATTSPMGAGNWRKDYNESLRGRRVVLLPDNDVQGKRHMEAVRQNLVGIALSVKVVKLPDLPDKGDVSDWLNAGGTKHALMDMAAKAAPLPSRKRATRATRATNPVNNGESRGEPVAHVAPVADEPWTGDLGELLGRVEAFLGRFIIYPSDHARIAHALWIAHTHAMDCWESTGRIAFLSPEPASGKTRCLEISELLVPRPVESVNASTAYLFRKVSDPAGRATILYDEIDTIFGPKANENEDIRGLLNAGHRRGATAGRCEVHGKTVVCVEYPAYCAVALAGLGFLPDTLMSRSVVVGMRRRAPGETVEAFRRRDHAREGHAIRDELARWATRATDEGLADHRPEMPDGIADRAADVWESLLTIADAAGGDWPNRARVAAVALVAHSQEDGGGSLGVRLLADLRAVWDGTAGMHSDEILKRLNALVESPWGDLKGKPLDSRGLARFLKPYGIKPVDVRAVAAGAEVNRKGYRRADLHDAWQRYVPEEPKNPDREPGEEG